MQTKKRIPIPHIMSHIKQQKKEPKKIKVKRQLSQEQIQSRIIEKHSVDRNKRSRSRQRPSERMQVLKKEDQKNPIEARQKMKVEQVSKLIQNLKIQCNKEEYLLMKDEDQVQMQRLELQKTSENVGELRRLRKIHGVERARFQEKLTVLMKLNQQKVERYTTQLLK